MNKPIDKQYRICRPVSDEQGQFTGRHEIFPGVEQNPYSPGEVFMALAEFNKLWKNVGLIPPRELEPFAVPQNPDCAVVRISDIDPDFFLPDESIVLTSMIATRQLSFLPILEGASRAGAKKKKRGVNRHPRQRRSKQAAVSNLRRSDPVGGECEE